MVKCIKEKCNYSYICADVSYCHIYDAYILNDECKLGEVIGKLKDDLIKKCEIFEKIIATDCDMSLDELVRNMR